MHDCVIMKKSMNFLKGQDFRNIDGSDKKFTAFCCHQITEEDKEVTYVSEYYRFLKFSRYLRDLRENKKIPKKDLINRLVRDVKNMSNLTEKEKELF